MTTTAPFTGDDLAVIRRLRTTAAAQCARTRMQPHRRELLRDALVAEAQRQRSRTADATVLALPRQRADRVLVSA